MLGKLMKYEIKASGRILLPLYLAFAGMAVLARLTGLLPESNVAVSLVQALFLFTFVLSAALLIGGTMILVVYRFYKNFATDEGYLMFSLPVKSGTHITAHLLSGLLFETVSILLLFGSVFLVFSHISTDGGQTLKELLPQLGAFLEEFSNYLGIPVFAGVMYLIIVPLFVMAVNLFFFYLCIAIGQTFAKNKLLASVVVYLVLNTVLQILTVILVFAVGYALHTLPIVTLIDIALAAIPLILAAAAIILFFANRHLLTRRLNLE